MHSWSGAFTRLWRASHFSLRAQRKVTKRKSTPKRRSTGILPCDSATGLRGFADSTSVCWQQTGRDPSRPPCGPFLRPAATAYGTLVARILRARAISNSASQSQSQSQSALIRLWHLLPPSGRRKINSRCESTRSREFASSWLRRMRSDRGPYAVAQWRREGPQGGSQGCEPVGCQSMDGLSANPGAAARSRRAGCPQTAASGWPSLDSGLLPFALRAGFAVRAAPAAQWLLS